MGGENLLIDGWMGGWVWMEVGDDGAALIERMHTQRAFQRATPHESSIFYIPHSLLLVHVYSTCRHTGRDHFTSEHKRTSNK